MIEKILQWRGFWVILGQIIDEKISLYDIMSARKSEGDWLLLMNGEIIER